MTKRIGRAAKYPGKPLPAMLAEQASQPLFDTLTPAPRL